jgi:hypothetical protein
MVAPRRMAVRGTVVIAIWILACLTLGGWPNLKPRNYSSGCPAQASAWAGVCNVGN